MWHVGADCSKYGQQQQGRSDHRRWTAVYDGHSVTVRKQIEGVSRVQTLKSAVLIGEIRRCCPMQTVVAHNKFYINWCQWSYVPGKLLELWSSWMHCWNFMCSKWVKFCIYSLWKSLENDSFSPGKLWNLHFRYVQEPWKGRGPEERSCGGHRVTKHDSDGCCQHLNSHLLTDNVQVVSSVIGLNDVRSPLVKRHSHGF